MCSQTSSRPIHARTHGRTETQTPLALRGIHQPPAGVSGPVQRREGLDVLTLSLATVLASFSTRRRRHGHLFGTALGAAALVKVGVGVVVLVVVVVLALWIYRRAKRR